MQVREGNRGAVDSRHERQYGGTLVAMQRGDNAVAAYEAKTHLSELLEKLEADGEIIITKHGVPVAKLVPVKREASAEQRAAARVYPSAD